MEGEGDRQPSAVAADAVSKVLDNDDLLIEILLRVGFPTTLVHAAIACKSWLGHVSDHAFLRRFRKLNPPHLLGFYIKYRPNYLRAIPTSFIPMLPQPPELASVVRHASFSLDAYLSLWPEILDCQNGNVFVRLFDHRTGSWSTGRVHRPLCRKRGLTFNPPLLYPELQSNGSCRSIQFLSKEDGDGLSYYYLYVEETISGKPESRMHVYMLQDGVCRKHHLLDHLPPVPYEPKVVLADNKIYVPAGMSDIIVLDLTTLSFSTIQPPRGVVHSKVGTTIVLDGDASGVYLIHVEELQLRIWIHKGDNWLLIDSICLREMYANLNMSGCMVKDEHTIRLMNQVVDYGDFVFLEMGGCILHLDIKCRTLRKVYEITNGCLVDIYPFMMIWPPTFPTLKYDSERLFCITGECSVHVLSMGIAYSNHLLLSRVYICYACHIYRSEKKID
ncbi:hypothetical protein VPH35_092057 [Triticum aestivum]